MSELHLQCQICLSGHMSLLSELDNKEMTKIASRKSRVAYKKGQILYYQGTTPMGLFCVHSGKVKVTHVGPNDKEQILYIVKENDFLGYRSLLSEELYSMTATVLEEAVICFIPKEDFLEVISSNPIFMQKLLKFVCQDLGIMEQKLSQFIGKNVRERLASVLLMLKETYKMEGQKSESIAINLTRKDLASITGSTTETVIRLLSEFKDEGLIEIDNRKIKVIDSAKLSHQANFNA
ncbi:hypothetical protein BFP97_12680 [Roseivirga sp. 4D4]|nr:hypothetical protein BFP97_12680 [Roseivirga sp. 4D4]